MKTGIEIYVSLILITVMAVLCCNFIVADINVADARDAYYAYYEEIDNANGSESVINACISDASEAGYSLSTEKTGNPDNPLIKLVFKYDFKITMLGVKRTHTIIGYVQEN